MVGKVVRLWPRKMGDGHIHITNILKRKREIIGDFENNVPSSRKSQHHITGNENINKIMLGLVSGFFFY